MRTLSAVIAVEILQEKNRDSEKMIGSLKEISVIFKAIVFKNIFEYHFVE